MPKKAEGEKMIVEFGVGILAICAAGYAVRRYRRREKWTKIREEQLRKLKRLKRKFEEEKWSSSGRPDTCCASGSLEGE